MSGAEFLRSCLGGQSIFASFSHTAQKFPNLTAVKTLTSEKTYSQLSADVERLAALLPVASATAPTFVGILSSRSYDTACAMLACTRQGICFVPLDPGFAAEQLDFIASDIPLSAVFCDPAHIDTARRMSDAVITLNTTASRETPAPRPTSGDDPACVLYTSGTTGTPKGVVVPHRAITHIAQQHDVVPVTTQDVILHASTPACDGGIYEIFLPLLNGAALAIVEGSAPSLSHIATTMTETGVTITPWYAGLFHMMIDAHPEAFANVHLCQPGGDVMSCSHAERLQKMYPDMAIVNGYGPTETFVQSTCHKVTQEDIAQGVIPIGTPLAGETLHVLDDDLNPVSAGEIGQLAIGGMGTALGYFNRPALTAKVFRPGPDGDAQSPVYLTGDLVKQRADGVYEFHGRVDRQVKLAGRRVEIDGIEEILRSQATVRDVAVALHTPDGQPKQLVAFVSPNTEHGDADAFIKALRSATAEHIHRDVFPRHVILRDALPLTKTGKVDRKALLAEWQQDTPQPTAKPADNNAIARIWQSVLGGRLPRADDTFFDLGGTSMQLIEAHAKIEQHLGLTFDIALMFEATRLSDLTNRLSALQGTDAQREAQDTPTAPTHDPIAIIGMAARLPGLTDLDAFWDASKRGESLIDHFDPAEAEDDFAPHARAAENYVPARSILSDVDLFDPDFFGMRKREADLTDPQARVFLEIAQEALDNAAIDPSRTTDRIGVFAGASMSTYLHQNLLADRAATEKFTTGFQLDYSLLAGNTEDGVATHVAHKLGLNGPALAVNTACSTSLTAIAMACQTLRAGTADVVLAGGVSITFPQKRGYLYQEGGMASPDGRCRPFDANAAGTVFGHGAGAVILKPLSKAQADGDTIHAVIHGLGMNNDGADKMSYSAPSVDGQAEAIRAAHKDARIDASDVGYVECHGTATPLGDVIEAAGLKKAFGDQDNTCWLGSAKANLGHLDAAAGVIGVIKTALALSKNEIPPMAHFFQLNPRISFDGSPFKLPTQTQAWDDSIGRFAGVSSFGVGGTNVHTILGPAPLVTEHENTATNNPVFLPLSAKSPEALQDMATKLADTLANQTETDLPSVAHTLQIGRRTFDHRACVSADSVDTAIKALRGVAKAKPTEGTDALVFMFPGQGAQYPGMGSGLYEADATYRHWIDTGAELLEPILGQDIRPLLLDQNLDSKDSARALRETWITQPALFLTEVALAHSLIARGLTPTRLVGHSVGEFSAAVIAGVLSFEDALRLIALRGRAMMDQPAGGMLAVRAPLADVQNALPDTLDIAATNAPNMQVVAGAQSDIDAFAKTLEDADTATQALHTSHAFHSRMMDPVRDTLLAAASTMHLNAPTVPIISTVTGEELDASTATDPAYWAGQARACVNFQAAVSAAVATEPAALLEVGPGRTLCTFAAQVLNRSSHRGVFHSLPDHARSVSDVNSVAAAISQLWCAGLSVDWSRQGQPEGRKIPLPSYPFQRVRCWVEPPKAAQPNAPDYPTQETITVSHQNVQTPDRDTILLPKLAELLSDLSGENIAPADADTSFLEFGFDSLFMGQVSQAIGRDFGVTIPFRRLLSDVSNLNALTAHLVAEMPADAPVFAVAAPAPAEPVVEQTPTAIVPVATTAAPMQVAPAQATPGLDGLMQAQLQTMQAIFAQQLQSAGGQVAAPQPVANTPVAPAAAPAPTPAPAPAPIEAKSPAAPAQPKAIKFGRGPAVTAGFFTDAQSKLIADLSAAYAAKFANSKAHTQSHRKVHADPRTVSAFSEDWKELVFPIVSDTSKGAYINDIDGNALVDLVNGFGQTAFGHSPDFVKAAVQSQMERGFPIGPQLDIAGPTAQKFADFVGHGRVTFCNTGSEAVMAAMRIARAVTGRETIVMFDKDYHGQFDEVLVKGRPNGQAGKGLPIAPGIPRSATGNMMVLPYGQDSALDWLRENAHDVAAVIVEPVQSRQPELRPKAFVQEIRDITAKSGSALVMDEVVTGFRAGPQGMQGVWGIQGDMATYGKVVGGGMPIGVLAGSSKFMDTLDGGHWQFGDNSCPEIIPTFFAGTFVRHPLVIAAVDATLDHMTGAGNDLWDSVPQRTETLAAKLRAALAARGMPDFVETYSSWFVLKASENDPFAAMLYPLMRLQGVHIMDSFCGFLTTEHGDAECDIILNAFENALDVLMAAGVFGLAPTGTATVDQLLSTDGTTRSYPLTESQMEIWLRHQMGGDAAAAFNESVSLDLKGTLNRDALDSACATLLSRHDALRALFARDGSGFALQDVPTSIIEDVDLADASNATTALNDFVAADMAAPFALTEGLPIRFSLLIHARDHHTLVITAHHIVADGWSFGVLLEELADLYTAAQNGTSADLPAAPSFAQYALQSAANPAQREAALTYWTDEFAAPMDLPDLPLDRPRPEQKSYAGDTFVHHMSADVLKQVKTAGARQGCTLFVSTYAATQMFLSRLSGASNIVLGVPYAAQQELPNSQMIGHCVQFLPIQAEIAEGATVADHLTHARNQVMSAFDHADTTFGAIVRALKPQTPFNRLPLTEVEFNLETRASDYDMAGLQAQVHSNAKKAVNFDLFFNLAETSEGLVLELHYNSDLFDAQTVAGWAKAYETTLTTMFEDPAQPVAQLPIWGDTIAAPTSATSDYARDKTLWQALAPSFEVEPGKTATKDANTRLTYAELDAEVATLAAHIQTQTTKANARIAVCVPRGVGMLVAMLAVSRAGHTYIPLDPNQPQSRLAEITRAAEADAVLALNADDAAFAGDTKLILTGDAPAGATPQAVSTSPENAAYVIFTSGSTGTPKGVEISHRAVINFLTSMAQAPGLTRDDHLLAVTTAMFDIAVLELFLPLFVGGTVEIARTEDVVDTFKLTRRLSQGDITCMQATPTLWDMALSTGYTPPNGFKALCGGEPLPADLAAKMIAQGADLWNMYGPTETTIWSAIKHVTDASDITIGSPIANTDLVILSEDGRPMPVGQLGELNIGGDGLAIGYLNRPDLTDAAFRDVDLNGTSRRLYKTGDLARQLPNGDIEVLGRIDTQVKLRGYRIELGEIETKLRALPEIDKAAVDLRETASGDKALVGYLVAQPGAEIRTTSVAQKLADLLPDYMIPRAWVTLDALPQTGNGKLDRKALPAPNAAGTVTRLRDQVAPETATEKRIAAIWQEVLSQDNIGTTDTIFALGADSLSIFRIAARMLQDGLNLEARHVIAHPTIAELAAFHDTQGADAAQSQRPSLSAFRGGARRRARQGGQA